MRTQTVKKSKKKATKPVAKPIAKPAAKPKKKKVAKPIAKPTPATKPAKKVKPKAKPAKKVKPVKANPNNKKKKPEWINMGKELKAARLKSGLTQLQIAKSLNVSPGRIAQWECGVDRPNEERLAQLSKLMSTPKGLKEEPKTDKAAKVAKPAKVIKPKKPAKAKKKKSAKNTKPAKVEKVKESKPKAAKVEKIKVDAIAKKAGTDVDSILKHLKKGGITPQNGSVSVSDLDETVINKIKGMYEKMEEIKSDEIFVSEIQKKFSLSNKRMYAAIRKLNLVTHRRYPKGKLQFGAHFKNAICIADANKLEDFFKGKIALIEVLENLSKFKHL